MIFDYQCLDCGNKHELFAAYDEKDLKVCPKCDKLTSTRVPSSIKLIGGLSTPGKPFSG